MTVSAWFIVGKNPAVRLIFSVDKNVPLRAEFILQGKWKRIIEGADEVKRNLKGIDDIIAVQLICVSIKLESKVKEMKILITLRKTKAFPKQLIILQ